MALTTHTTTGAGITPSRGIETLNRYFALSDTVVSGHDDLTELIALFGPDIRLEPAVGPVVEGRDAVADFFDRFFADLALTHHLWRSRVEDGRIIVEWVVAVERVDGTLAALAGTDTAVVNPEGLITHLTVSVRSGRPQAGRA